MQKKSQITLFMILGIMLLAGIIIYFMISSKYQMPPSGQQLNTDKLSPFRNYIDSCFKNAVIDAVFENSKRGGYSSVGIGSQINPVFYSGFDVPVYFSRDGDEVDVSEIISNFAPNLEEEALKKFQEHCTNFSDFEKQGYNIITEKDPEINVTINEKDISAELNVRYAIMLGGLSSSLEQVNTVIPINLDRIIKEIVYIVEAINAAGDSTEVVDIFCSNVTKLKESGIPTSEINTAVSQVEKDRVTIITLTDYTFTLSDDNKSGLRADALQFNFGIVQANLRILKSPPPAPYNFTCYFY